jgi:hypothetical protein
MPKTVSAETLLKRLQKIERAQARLGGITTRIRAQAETLAALLEVAQTFVDEGQPAKRAAAPRSTAPARRTAAKGAAAKRTTARATAKTRAAAAPSAPATRRAPRKAAPA